MKRLIISVIVLGVLAAGGYGVYIAATDIGAEKVAEKASATLKESGRLDEVKAYVETDPQLQAFVEEAKAAEPEALPFQTRGEATRVLVQKVGVSELKEMADGVQSGTLSKDEAIQKLEAELTEEELLALKVIAYKELYE